MNHYKKSLLRIPKLAIACFGIALLAKIIAVLVQLIHGHATAFDEAVKLLIHYPEALGSIMAFFAVVIFFLCITLIFEPSDIGRLSRKWILVPSLHVIEHMLTLAIGVFAAWALIDSFTVGIPYGSVSKTIGVIILAVIVLGALASLCAAGAEFLEQDFDNFVQTLGRARFLVLFLIGAILIVVVYVDFVWNYKLQITGN